MEKKIITNNNPRYVQRESGIITPFTKEDERYTYFPNNYELIAHYVPSMYPHQPRLFVEDSKLDEKDFISRRFVDYERQAVEIASNESIPIEEGKLLDPRKLRKYLKQEKICRFCRKKEPEVKFKENAHAISEQLGNHTVFLLNECDTCNDIFSVYEDSFAKYLGALRTVCRIEGKHKIPKYLGDDNTISLEVGNGGTIIQEIRGSGHVEISDKQIDMEFEKQPYVPIDVYKALVTMALSIMPDNEFKEFESSAKWLINEKKELEFSGYASQVIIRFIPGPNPLKLQAWLLRRKSFLTGGNKVFDVPYSNFIIEFNNLSFQIIVPNVEKDAMLIGRTVTVPMFVSSFNYFCALRKYGDSEDSVHDFSGKERIEGEKQKIRLSIDRCEDISGQVTDAQTMAAREGVTPLFEAVSRKKK